MTWQIPMSNYIRKTYSVLYYLTADTGKELSRLFIPVKPWDPAAWAAS